jgi:hypothetical protein
MATDDQPPRRPAAGTRRHAHEGERRGRKGTTRQTRKREEKRTEGKEKGKERTNERTARGSGGDWMWLQAAATMDAAAGSGMAIDCSEWQ